MNPVNLHALQMYTIGIIVKFGYEEKLVERGGSKKFVSYSLESRQYICLYLHTQYVCAVEI